MRPRITFANVVSVIALFVALGGTAIATHPGGQNTVSTADIQNGEVKTDDIGNGEVKVADIGQGAVATEEIVNGQVKASDVGDGEVKAAEIANGQVTSDELAANSVRAEEVADGQVRSPEIGNGQVQAEDLAAGVAPGASGARARGLVNVNGTLIRSKQVTAVANPFEGIFCIDPAPGIDPSTAVMVVGEDSADNETDPADNANNVTHAEWDSDAADCPAGTMEVLTFVGNGSLASGGGSDFGGFDLIDLDQSFTFVIP